MLLGQDSSIPSTTTPPYSSGDSSSLWSSITGAFQSIGTALNTYQINQANIVRAQQGLPPITSADVAPTVNVGIDPQLKTALIIGAIGLGAILLLSRR